MKFFEVPTIDIAKFDIKDVIATSSDEEREDEFPLV